jgi:type IV secretory pathway TraG/TraD family ATPase VirD4
MILQSVGQLDQNCQKSWETILVTCGWVSAYAPRDLTTAKYLSELWGHKIVSVPNEGIQIGTGQQSYGTQEAEKPKYRPEQLMARPLDNS